MLSCHFVTVFFLIPSWPVFDPTTSSLSRFHHWKISHTNHGNMNYYHFYCFITDRFIITFVSTQPLKFISDPATPTRENLRKCNYQILMCCSRAENVCLIRLPSLTYTPTNPYIKNNAWIYSFYVLLWTIPPYYYTNLRLLIQTELRT